METRPVAEAPKIDPGQLPAWGEAEIPAPPPFSVINALRLIGPAAIALGTSIGSGEWLLGPAVTAKYGAGLLWVATISILLQVVLNQEMIRYTLATGEPIFTGFLRTRPGPTFWGPFYTVLMFLQIGWPGWALSAATAIAAAFLGRIPGDADKALVLHWGYATFAACLLIIALGNKVEKTLERVEWFMIAWILIFLLVVGLFCTTLETWGKVFGGFFGLSGRPIPEGKDWVLLASFAAYAGMGGVGNGTISNWVRDKGWGMASTVGHIPGLIGGKVVPLSRVGKIFPLNTENLHRFREWLKYAHFEQYLVFGFGCFLGMALPALLTLQFVPQGTDIIGTWGGATYQAEGIGRAFGQAAWSLTLLNAFWIMFSTQLGNTDILARTVTDMAWSTHPWIRKATREDVRKLYYTVLLLFTLFGVWAIRQATPGVLIVLGAFMASFNFVVIGIHVLVVQKRFLPRALQMPWWREGLIYLFILLFIAATGLGVWSKWSDILKVVPAIGSL
jgi:hypothetical protein